MAPGSSGSVTPASSEHRRQCRARVRHAARPRPHPRLGATSPTTWCANAAEHPRRRRRSASRSGATWRDVTAAEFPRRGHGRRQGPGRRRRRARATGSALLSRHPLRVDPAGLRDLVRRGGQRPPLRDVQRRAGRLDPRGLRGDRRRSSRPPRTRPSSGRRLADQPWSAGVAHMWSMESAAIRRLGESGAAVADDELEARRSALGPASLGDARLHLGDHGATQGLRAHARQLHVRGRVGPRRPLRRCSRATRPERCCSFRSRTCSHASSRWAHPGRRSARALT